MDEAAAAALPRMAELARTAAQRVCTLKPSPDLATFHRELALVVFGLLQQSNDEFKSLGIGEDIFAFDGRVRQAGERAQRGDIPNMITWQEPDGAGIQFIVPIPVTDVAKCDALVSRARTAGRVAVENCRRMFDRYVDLYSYAQNIVQARTAEPVEKYLTRMIRDWDQFLSKSRSQTPLELALNTWYWERGESAGKFLAPPSMQFIVLHPSVVIERVGQAADGNHTKEGILLEVAGANWWRNDEWYQPSGGSVVLLYSERPGISGWRAGVAAHFGNKYTIGLTSNAGQRGIFFSLDVLELAKDKSSMLRKYVGDALRF